MPRAGRVPPPSHKRPHNLERAAPNSSLNTLRVPGKGPGGCGRGHRPFPLALLDQQPGGWALEGRGHSSAGVYVSGAPVPLPSGRREGPLETARLLPAWVSVTSTHLSVRGSCRHWRALVAKRDCSVPGTGRPHSSLEGSWGRGSPGRPPVMDGSSSPGPQPQEGARLHGSCLCKVRTAVPQPVVCCHHGVLRMPLTLLSQPSTWPRPGACSSHAQADPPCFPGWSSSVSCQRVACSTQSPCRGARAFPPPCRLVTGDCKTLSPRERRGSAPKYHGGGAPRRWDQEAGRVCGFLWTSWGLRRGRGPWRAAVPCPAASSLGNVSSPTSGWTDLPEEQSPLHGRKWLGQ